ncbi:winged helix DNA-binding domain-containing protein [Luteimicrobium sp. DT211]|uniref:winged helix DNA-binding domain-containing protein n=1 Tax=Luteimicrobium sp. DT211 TaxID=3393412 RepID=UPI003CF04B6E
MPLTLDDLNRATLARQLLLARERLPVPEAVRRIAAVQAQEPASPYLALWNRVDGFDPAALDAAFADGTVVRATLMRITFHAVHADDWAPFHRAVTDPLRRSRLGDRRFLPAGLTIPEANELRDVLAAFAAEPRTQEEVVAFLTDRLDDPERAKAAWWALRTFAPLRYVPTGSPWSYDPRRRTLHALASTAADAMPPGDDPAVVHLLRRYLEAFGPASEADFGQFTMLRRTFSGPAIAALRGDLVELEGPDGARLLDLPDAPRPPAGTPAPPRLLGMWDDVLLAHRDRTRLVPPGYAAHVLRRNGDALPTLLVDGRVAGAWRTTPDGIEATAFHDLPEETWEGLDAEARSLRALLADRQPLVYARYDHWWPTLPAAQVRTLGR